MDHDELAARIRAELGYQGLTHTELANRLGRPRQWLHRRLHRGKDSADFSIGDVQAIAAALNVPVDNFTGSRRRR